MYDDIINRSMMMI